MRSAFRRATIVASLAVAVMFAMPLGFAQTPSSIVLLHTFGTTDAQHPVAGLIMDAAGNLYGTTISRDSDRPGAVFELLPGSNGAWTEKVVYSFLLNGKDGESPSAALFMDAAGNLYGTTPSGGVYAEGTVFELIPGANGTWTEKKLHDFGSGTDGREPYCVLIMDTAGNLYGTTTAGGAQNAGTVFELMPGANGVWREKRLYDFGSAKDGQNPYAGLLMDALGNLYGSTFGGGSASFGTVFELISGANGTWTEKLLHNFGSGTDGRSPYASLIMDTKGNLYGTAYEGGANSAGSVFQLSPTAKGGWSETRLHDFGSGTDGAYPYAELIMDVAGNLYGTTLEGGTGFGTVFSLSPGANHMWTETLLNSFGNLDNNGCGPYAGLIRDTTGNLYSTTEGCGASGFGTVFEITQ